MTHQDADHPKINEEEAEEIVSPENTEKLYGLKAIEDDPGAANPDNVPTEMPEDTDGVAEDNVYNGDTQ